MKVFATITDQLNAVRMPLFAVTLTAVPRLNTPVLLMLHWHASAQMCLVTTANRALRPSQGRRCNSPPNGRT